jgi:hypothetical protein
MSFVKGFLGAMAVAALIFSIRSARANDFVYGSSSGLTSAQAPPNGDFLALTYSDDTKDALIGTSSFVSNDTPIILGDSGWFTSTTEEGPSGDNYVTGNISGSNFRSFLSFDIADLSSGVLSATLVLDTYNVATSSTELVEFLGGVNNLDGDGAVDSTTDANSLLTIEESSTPSSAEIGSIYNALGTGPLYGSQIYTTADSGTQISIPLSSSFITDINTSLATGNSLFTVGLDDVSQVPEPGSIALIAIAASAALRRRFHPRQERFINPRARRGSRR